MSTERRVQKATDGAPTQDKRELLKRILQQEELNKSRAAIGRRPAADTPAPLSFGQEGLWFLDKVTAGDDSYRVLLLMRFDGRLDIEALQLTLREILCRHEVLRSVFPERDGRPVIVVTDVADVALPITDVPAQTEAGRERELDRVIRADYAIPFDLAHGPLFRARLVRYAADAHCLLLMIHHIAADGWSSGVLYQELCAIYAAFAQGGPSPLPEPQLQYADYAAWQRQRLQGQFFEKQLAYWKQNLHGASALVFPKDRPQSALSSFAAVTEERVLPRPLGAALRELSRQQGATLFVTLLAAFEILLHRYSGQDDIVIGTPVLTRNRPELESMIGLLVNMAALRLDFADDPTFLECLRRVRQMVLGANDHAEIPFEKVVQAVQPERVARRNPIFQVAFAMDMGYQPVFSQRRELPGLTISPVHKNDILTHLDMEVYLRDTGADIAVLMVCGADAFEAATVTRMLDHYVRILEAVVADPRQRIAQVSLLNAQERRCLLEEWSGAESAFAQDRTAHGLFEPWAARAPQALAVEFEGASLSYAELNMRANRLARTLQARGVGHETLVGVCLERGIDLIVALLAIWKAGGAYVPLDPNYPPVRLQYMVQDAGLPVIVSRGALIGVPGAYAGAVVSVDADAAAIAGQSSDPLPSPASAASLAYVIYTSGSTGRPKGTLLEHRGLGKVSAEQIRWFGAGPGSRVLQFSSPNFDASVFEISMALTTGATLVLARQEDLQPGPPLARLLRDQRISILTIPPSSLSVLPETPLPELKVINVAGEACPAALVERWAPGRRFFNLYGPTECTIWSTVQECVAGEGAPPIGRPIGNTKLYVLDAQRQPVPVGVPGELYIGGVGVARGYLNLEALSAERFIADPFARDNAGLLYRSGDKVRWRADGTLEFIGRIDQQVKVRGFRIELGEIEAVLGRQPGVDAAVVVARADAGGDKRLVAYVVPQTGQSVGVEGLRAALQGQLPAYMVPAAFVRLEALPLTPNGKVDHKSLPTPVAERQVQAAYIAPGIGLEAEIAAVWKGLLGLDAIGVEDNFFDLGGHSLLLVQVHEKLKQLTGRELPIATLFQFPTVRALARHLDQDAAAPIASPVPQPLPGQAAPGSANAYRIEPIAVIGMAGRFPGARDLDEYWDNLRAGVESIRFFSEQELLEAGCDPQLISDPRYVPAKGYLEHADRFDAQFFGYSPREAELIDPQQRLFLECAWEALETAGYDPDRYPGQIGVYAGASMNTYQLRLYSPSDALPLAGGIQGVISNDKDFLPTRVSYKFNLRGPSVNVQTACSTSLVAVHQACRSLLTDDCDMALAGGASVNAPLVTGYLYESGSIASPDGHCRAFDAAAQGTVGGNGVGVVVLKRLSRAQADGDVIHAVIRGSAINNDGSIKVGYTAPSVEGQSQAIANALRLSGVEPASIGYIETHGTGTRLGDPIEIAALQRVFGGGNTEQRIALGSVKTNFGHLDAAAGVAGFIKTVLALEHKQLPPTLHFEAPNPELHLDETPFHVNTRLTDWAPGAAPRRAGVSSFGIGGTNAHVVLEEAPAPASAAPSRAQQLLVLSARTASALDSMSDNLAAALRRRPGLDLADVAYTLQVGRKRFRHARVVVCRDGEQAIAALERRSGAFPSVFTGVRESNDRPVAFMFPGQGSQYINMARGLYAAQPGFRALIDACAEKLLADLGADLRDIIYPPTDAAADAAAQKLTLTRYAQPALFVIDYALARLWMQWGIQPVAMIGHSLGEYVAACLAGVMTLDDALRLVTLRARLMSELPGGKMLAVPLPAAELQPLLDAQLSIASVNGPALTVISGPGASIAHVQARLAAQGVEARLLHTSHAFHSAMMDPILKEFTEQMAAIPLSAPKLPYLSNVTGDWITPGQATDPAYYARHLRHTVQFAPGLERLFAHPEWMLLEVGPGQTLSTLARRHPGKPAQEVLLASSRHPDKVAADDVFILETLGQMWIAGVNPDWQALQGERRRRVVLPTYPFERQRFWIETSAAAAPGAKPRHRADPDEWVYAPSWRRVPMGAGESEKHKANWLCFADPRRLGTPIENALRARGATVVSVEIGERFAKHATQHYTINPAQAEDYARLLGELIDASVMPQYILHLWSIAATDAPSREDAAQDDRLIYGIYSLVHLVRALERHAVTAPLGVAVVTDQVHEVDGQERISPEQAMVLGPCKVIGMEYPNLRLRSIDLALNDADARLQDLAHTLTEDLCAAWSEPVVAYRGRYRWAQSFEQVALKPATGIPGGLRHSGVYLITGGLGAVGLELAHYLARSVAARLTLVSRGAMPARQDWDSWLREHADTDAVSRRIRKLRDIEALGAEVLIHQADVADQRQLAAAVAATEARFAALHGVIHAAGAEKRITTISAFDQPAYAEQFRPKLQGLRALEQALAGRRLDFCVVNSSLASVMGVMGAVAYTAAHVFADAFVHHHNRQSDTPWIAINWDNWNSDEVMATGTQRAPTGFQMNPRDATGIFGRLLDHPQAGQFLISTGDLQQRIDQWVGGQDHPAEQTAETVSAHTASGHPRPALSVEYTAPRTATETRLTEIWRTVLGIDQIGIHDNFFELGGDSVLNIQITARANQAGLALTPKQVFEHQTIAELAAVAGVEHAREAEQGIVSGAVPLTPIQQWFFEHHADNPHHFNLPMLLDVRQPLDRALLEQSLQRLLAHHDALRLRYARDDAGWRQRILETGEPVVLQWHDLGAEVPAEQSRQIETQGARLQQSLDITHGPLLQAAYFDLGSQQAPRLLLVLHHLCVDIISWRILLEDLQSSYQALAAGREPSLPLKTVSIKRWAEAMEDYAQTEQAESELEFWRAVGAHDLAGLPVDNYAGGNTADSSATIVAQLSGEHTRSLITDIPRLFNASVNDALLLALAQAVARAAGQTGLFVALEGHGRERLWEGADPSRTVGWFTSLYPVLLRVPGGSDVAAQLAAVRDQYRAIPNHGVGYGILRYLSRRQDVRDLLGDLPQPQISFLYMGQADQAFPADALFVPAAGDTGPAYDPAGERAHLLELNSGISQGQFRISWTYSSNRHRAETVQALADAFIDALRDLIEQTRRVHAPDGQGTDERGVDFTAEALSADDLAEILRQQES